MSETNKVLQPDGGLNENVVKAEYAVRGKLYLEAQKRESEGKEVIFTNIGNPQSLGQTPITFPRQVLALMTCPMLLEHENVGTIFPEDAIARAKEYLAHMHGGTGAYQDSRGNMHIREDVAKFIERRDGFPADAEHIFLSDGASVAIQRCLQLTIRSEKDAILLPIPQYPLYSATIQLLGGKQLSYYLLEDDEWSLDIEGLNKTVSEARAEGFNVRAIVVINPGNPTGQVLSKDNMVSLVHWALENNVVIFADEVYQENIYGKKPFVSFKQVVSELGTDAEDVELFSFHSVSKGVFGECGRRGGYVESTHIHPEALAQLYKLFSVSLCSNVDGMITTGIMCNPPKEGDASYPLYHNECDTIFQSLKRRAQKLSTTLNELDGISCNHVEGAMYAFPQVEIPKLAVEAAEKEGEKPDSFYCLRLLHATGMCVVPGSGFGQRDGTFHFRTTILPQEDVVDRMLESFKEFHIAFIKEFSYPSSKM
eukprot:m.22863 g.22863  ORF g.22863 m.22863 type:complete len:481 (+) comp5488_c0_seq1:139-1581(+)